MANVMELNIEKSVLTSKGGGKTGCCFCFFRSLDGVGEGDEECSFVLPFAIIIIIKHFKHYLHIQRVIFFLRLNAQDVIKL